MAAKRKYGWERWFGRSRTELVRGVDYHCAQAIMWQMVRNNARRYGVRVRVTDTHDGILIEVLDEVPHSNPAPVAG